MIHTHTQPLKFLKALIFLGAFIACMVILPQANAQFCGYQTGEGCSNTDYNNSFMNSGNTETIEYDNWVSTYHSTMVRRSDGQWAVWGEAIANDGTSHVAAPLIINRTNFPALSPGAKIYKVTGGSYNITTLNQPLGAQFIALASDGLYVWGKQGIVLDPSLTISNTFAKTTLANNGLPVGVSPADVKMMTATYRTLLIVTCSGDVWVLSQNPYLRGNGATGNSTTWYKVQTDSSNYLTGIVAARTTGRGSNQQESGVIALRKETDGTFTLWGWGDHFRNGITALNNQSFADSIVHPAPSKTIKMIGITMSTVSANGISYFVLMTDGNLYAIGSNNQRQLGTWGTTQTNVWVQPRYNSTTGPLMDNIKWISPKENDAVPNASINALTNSGTLYSWGYDELSSIGRCSVPCSTSSGARNPDIPNGLTSTDVVFGVETGGHTSMIAKCDEPTFGYVGHRIYGSMGNGVIDSSLTLTESSYSYNTASVPICGANYPSIDGFSPISVRSTGGALCVGQEYDVIVTPTGGTVTVTSNPGSIVTLTGNSTSGYQIVFSAPGTITLSYQGPNQLGCTPDPVTINVTAAYCVPQPDINQTYVGVTVSGSVTTNDKVVSGTTYGTSPTLASGPSGGSVVSTLTMNSNGTYTFVSNTPGVYVYNVPVCAPGQSTGCPTETLTITVLDNIAVPQPPIANPDIAITQLNTAVTLRTLINDKAATSFSSLNAGSVTVLNPLTGTGTSGTVANGSFSVNTTTGDITFTPNTGFVGVVTYSYQVCDNSSTPLCATSFQEITILPAGSANTTLAVDDYAFVSNTNTSGVSGNVLTNDIDPEGNTMTVTAQTVVVNGKGTLTLNTNGSYTFVPVSTYHGPVNFPYTMCDNGTPQACSNATLYILVEDVTILPVSFISLNAECAKDKVIVKWQTAQETNNSHFEVQKNRNSEWIKIGAVKGAGTSYGVKSYQFNDPIQGEVLHLYRIKQVDFDGHSEISQPIVAICSETNAVGNQINLYPNPVTNVLNIVSESESIGNVEVMDINGKRLIVTSIDKASTELDLSHLAPGMYFIKVNERVFKLVKE